ncbi:MAG: hypothetical protein R3E97_19905 [Candidatus Eisenbacteria bacterium]
MRVLTGLLALVLAGCASSSTEPLCVFRVPSDWSPWRELLGASISYELDDGRTLDGKVTRVAFFPATEIGIRAKGESEVVTLSFDEARDRLTNVEYSREYEWSRYLGKYVPLQGAECLVTAVSLEPDRTAIVMTELGAEREFRAVTAEALMASIRDRDRD